MSIRSINYKDLNLDYVDHSGEEPQTIQECLGLLYPKSVEDDDKFYTKEILFPIIEYVVAKLKKEPLNTIYDTRTVERCIQLYNEKSEYKLALELIQKFKTQQYLTYIEQLENKTQTYKLETSLLYFYIETKWQTNSFDEKDKILFINFFSALPKTINAYSEEIYELVAEIFINLLNDEGKQEGWNKFIIVRLCSFLFNEAEVLRYYYKNKEYSNRLKVKIENFCKTIEFKSLHRCYHHMLYWSKMILCEDKDIDKVAIQEAGNIFESITKNVYLDNEEYIEELLKGYMGELERALFLEDPQQKIAINTLYETLKIAIEIRYKSELIAKRRLSLQSQYLFFEKIFEEEKYTDYYSFYSVYLNADEREKIDGQLMFQTAFVLAECDLTMEARKLYTRLLNEEGPTTSVLNNLALLYRNEKDYTTALELLEQGEALDPSHEKIQNQLKKVRKYLKDEEMRPQKMKDVYFKHTEKLDKRVIFAIYKLQGSEYISDKKLMEVTSISSENYFSKIIKNLKAKEIVFTDKSEGYKLDQTISDLVGNYIDPKIERKIVKGDSSKFYRSIFYHESEINLYRALLELFPQHLVFPNMDLKTIIEVDKIRNKLDSDIMEYMFKAHVDFAIINTTTYFPIITFEKDSEYQDKEPHKSNVVKKNLIFQTSGLPLIRLRYSSAMDYERLKEEIKQTTRLFLLDVKSSNNQAKLLQEFDLKRFGIVEHLPSVEELTNIWSEIVGPLIAENTIKLEIDQEYAALQIHISKQLKSIINLSQENIKAQLYQRVESLNQVKLVYSEKE